MKSPNYALALALAEAGWNNSETARRINTLARERGHHGVAADRSRVSRWIRHGERPRPPVPDLLADLLTRHLNRPYTPNLLGISPAHSVLVPLDLSDHRRLMEGATAVNMSVEHYAQALLRRVLSQPGHRMTGELGLARSGKNDLGPAAR
ncbi:hypothetical protein ACFW6E_38350 [Streptomyces olivaceoviridis]|uniref:hypothetical protein n=1 Tax=Streptomyces olivaceoviridis TaxID=1921 RepID=UPI0036CA5C16